MYTIEQLLMVIGDLTVQNKMLQFQIDQLSKENEELKQTEE